MTVFDEVDLAVKEAVAREALAEQTKVTEELIALQKIVSALRRDPLNRRWILDDVDAAFHNLDITRLRG